MNDRYRVQPKENIDFDEKQFNKIKELLEEQRENVNIKHSLIKLMDLIKTMKDDIDNTTSTMDGCIVSLNLTYNIFIKMIETFSSELLE